MQKRANPTNMANEDFYLVFTIFQGNNFMGLIFTVPV